MIPFRIGADASCTDGACGQVSRIIVNPVTREVTHLAVDPKHRYGPGRLVPVDLVDATTGQIRLRCPLAEFQTLRLAEETEGGPDLDPTGHGHPDNAPNKVKWAIVGGSVIRQPGARGEPEAPQQVTVDYVPEGEVEVHRELTVCAKAARDFAQLPYRQHWPAPADRARCGMPSLPERGWSRQALCIECGRLTGRCDPHGIPRCHGSGHSGAPANLADKLRAMGLM